MTRRFEIGDRVILRSGRVGDVRKYWDDANVAVVVFDDGTTASVDDDYLDEADEAETA